MNPYELAANAFVATAIVLAARNSIHTWWSGIVGCAIFACVFFEAKLYADVTLQGFFIITGGIGWYRWLHGHAGAELPVRFSKPSLLAGSVALALVTAMGYGWLLYRFTDAYAPFLDSLLLTFSVLGQFLMMERRVENWWAWLLVNTIAVPLYASRGLYVTSVLYGAYWINAIVALVRWRRMALGARAPDSTPQAPGPAGAVW
ncbi:MAG: nicotinamide mononucleotide transporter [Acidobacteria bacterium]|nr:nicotinamide mononucleotide transporter [Acidobacteriota bacterium]